MATEEWYKEEAVDGEEIGIELRCRSKIVGSGGYINKERSGAGGQ